MIKIKNIIFDLGGVILFQPKELMHTVLNEVFPEKIDQAYGLWNQNKDKVLLGEMSSEELIKIFKEMLRDETPLKLMEQKIKLAYKKHVAKVNYDLLSCIKDLRKRYKIYLLTDTIDQHDEYNKTRNIYTRFDRVFKSFEEHFLKTDINAFKNVLKKIHAKPEEILFIDDLEENVLNAKQLGINSIIYKNLKQLKDKLKNYEITI